MRTLIVEDDPLLALDLENIVASVGHRVIGPVSTAVEALEMVERNPLDLALLDICLLDGVSGLTVAKHLKQRWAIPVIFISASIQEMSLNRDLAVATVSKPFLSDAVIAALEIAEAAINETRYSVPAHLAVSRMKKDS